MLIKAGVDGGRVRGQHVAHAIRFPLRFPDLGIRVMNVSLGVSPDARRLAGQSDLVEMR